MAHPSDSEAGIVAIAQSHHLEHKSILRDGIIGFADGLTVPFALTAGLSSYVLLHRVVRDSRCEGYMLTGFKVGIIQASSDRWSG